MKMAVQHFCYPRTKKGDRQLDVTEHAAELSKDGPRAKAKKLRIRKLFPVIHAYHQRRQ